jgi:phage terminase large subunit-like protein
MSSNDRVNRIIAFIEQLVVPSGKGEGQPFRMRKFQRRFIRDVYGLQDRNGNRRIRRAILSIARKNGKTALIATLALVHLIGPEAVRNGEIYSAANDREQAAIVFKYAAQIVRADPELMAYIKIIDSTKTMVCYSNGSMYRAVSAEVGTKFGLNPTVVIYDELAQARNRELYDALDTSMAARTEPLFITISTQSNDPQHILSQLIDDGLRQSDPTTITHLYAVPDDAEGIFNNKSVWKKANPALGDFRSLSEMQTMAKRAQRMPTFENSFRNLYLNQRVNYESPLIPKAEWLGCRGDAEIEDGEEVYLGLDLSGKTDLTALVAVSAGEKDKVKAWFWKPQASMIQHEDRDRVPYRVWERQGYIETTPGRAIQYDWIAVRLADIITRYSVIGLAFDRYRIDDLLNSMGRIGIECYVDSKEAERSGALRMVPWGQGYASMTQAVEALEVSILERKFIHDGNPVLTWNFSNAVSISDAAGNRKIDKSKTRFRIDGTVATAMAIGLKSRDLAKEPPESVYETRGVMTFGTTGVTPMQSSHKAEQNGAVEKTGISE